MKESIKDLIKLTDFELGRVSKLLFTLMGFTLISNLIAYVVLPYNFMRQIKEYTVANTDSVLQIQEHFSKFSFYNVVDSIWIIAPIFVGITAILFYSIFTWYREWFGKNTFAYRLLLLPVARMNIFFSKLITVFISIFTLLATQMVSIAIGYPIISLIVDSNFLDQTSLIEILRHSAFVFLFPMNVWYFLAINGTGLVILLGLFSVILMERSFGVKGIILGVGYVGLSTLIILAPLSIPSVWQNYFIIYSTETLMIEIALFTLSGLLSIFISRHLINHKITI